MNADPLGMKTSRFYSGKRKRQSMKWFTENEMNMKNTIEHSGKVSESEIAVVAYQMWETAGQPAGQDLRFWFDAQAQLRAAAKPAPAAPASHLSQVESRISTVPKPANMQLGPSQPNPSKPQPKFRKF